MNNKDKVPYFVETSDGFKFIGFFEPGSEPAPAGYRAHTASDLYRMVTKANEALNSIDLNHPTLKD